MKRSSCGSDTKCRAELGAKVAARARSHWSAAAYTVRGLIPAHARHQTSCVLLAVIELPFISNLALGSEGQETTPVASRRLSIVSCAKSARVAETCDGANHPASMAAVSLHGTAEPV